MKSLIMSTTEFGITNPGQVNPHNKLTFPYNVPLDQVHCLNQFCLITRSCTQALTHSANLPVCNWWLSFHAQVAQSQFHDFLGQINALKVVVVQLEQKLREKSEEQVLIRTSYYRTR